MLKKKTKIKFSELIIITAVFLVVVLGFSNSAKAGVVFEDNFDRYDDWSSITQYNIGEDQINTEDKIFGGERLDGVKGWHSYRASAESHTLGHPLFEVNSDYARGETGKSLKVWYESNVSVQGGGVDLYFGGTKGASEADQAKTGYDEVYIRYAAKYDPNWITDDGSFLKLFRLYSGKAPDWGDDLSVELLGSAVYLIEAKRGSPYNYESTGLTMYYIDIPNVTGTGCLCAFPPPYPSTYCNDKGWTKASASGGINLSQYMSDWIIIQLYAKMNTPGQYDGVVKVWVNNGDPNNPNQTVTGLMIRDTLDKKFNTLVALDNLQKYTTSVKTEEYLVWDDLVISTNYVPVDYVPGGGTFSPTDVNQDGKVNIQDIQICVKVITGALTNSRADVNGDGSVNIKDIQVIVKAI